MRYQSIFHTQSIRVVDETDDCKIVGLRVQQLRITSLCATIWLGSWSTWLLKGNERRHSQCHVYMQGWHTPGFSVKVSEFIFEHQLPPFLRSAKTWPMLLRLPHRLPAISHFALSVAKWLLWWQHWQPLFSWLSAATHWRSVMAAIRLSVKAKIPTYQTQGRNLLWMQFCSCAPVPGPRYWLAVLMSHAKQKWTCTFHATTSYISAVTQIYETFIQQLFFSTVYGMCFPLNPLKPRQ